MCEEDSVTKMASTCDKDGVNVGQGRHIVNVAHRWEKDDAKVSE